jgi:hypothetical protein
MLEQDPELEDNMATGPWEITPATGNVLLLRFTNGVA